MDVEYISEREKGASKSPLRENWMIAEKERERDNWGNERER